MRSGLSFWAKAPPRERQSANKVANFDFINPGMVTCARIDYSTALAKTFRNGKNNGDESVPGPATFAWRQAQSFRARLVIGDGKTGFATRLRRGGGRPSGRFKPNGAVMRQRS